MPGSEVGAIRAYACSLSLEEVVQPILHECRYETGNKCFTIL